MTRTITVTPGCDATTTASSRCPPAVIVETSWQIERNLGPASEAGFLRLVTAGEVEVIDLGLDDYRRCVELIETYADMKLGLVDAIVICVAEVSS